MRKYFILFTILIIVTLKCFIFAFAETEHFEKGDLIFREKGWFERTEPFFPRLKTPGHTGIYCQWGPKEELAPTQELPDPEIRASHKIIEAPGLGGKVWEKSYEYFYNIVPNGFLGGGTKVPRAQDRQRIVDLAYARLGWRYSFFEGYKDGYIRKKLSKTYRCDGLAEHCYELVGYDIVPYDTWLPAAELFGFIMLTPKTQKSLMGVVVGHRPHIEITKPSDDEILTGVYTLEAHADDGDYGSGIAQVEFWAGGSDCEPDIITTTGAFLGKEVKKVLIKGDYSYNWYTPFVDDDEYTVYAKAFDQAGNTRVSDGVRVIVNNIPPIIINERPTGEISETRPTISATIVSEDNIVPVDLSTVAVTLDGVRVAHSASPNVNSFSVKVSCIPSVDLDAGPHTVTIDAEDISGLGAKKKTWNFTITTPTPPEDDLTGGDWQGLLTLLNKKRTDIGKGSVSVSHPEDIDMDGVLTIRGATANILGDYGFAGLTDALNCAGYAQGSWSEGFDCKGEIEGILNLMHTAWIEIAELDNSASENVHKTVKGVTLRVSRTGCTLYGSYSYAGWYSEGPGIHIANLNREVYTDGSGYTVRWTRYVDINTRFVAYTVLKFKSIQTYLDEQNLVFGKLVDISLPPTESGYYRNYTFRDAYGYHSDTLYIPHISEFNRYLTESLLKSGGLKTVTAPSGNCASCSGIPVVDGTITYPIAGEMLVSYHS